MLDRLSPRARSAALVAATAVMLGLGAAAPPATAQLGGLIGSDGTTTTTTTAPPGEPAPPPDPAPTSSTTTTTTSSTTTTTAPGVPLPSPSPAPGPQPGPPPPQEGAPPPPPGGGDDSEPLPEDGYAGFPPHLAAMRDSIARSGPRNTRALLDALAPLVELGYSEEEVAVAGFGRFPVAGYASYIHDWWFPRFGPTWRLHQGTDIFAARGTPVRAPVDGRVRITNGGLGGLAVYVIQPDGTYYYLAHLAGLAEGLHEGQEVRTGQVVGFVGDSGNARGGATHLHIQIHPYGGDPIDPKPILDKFLDDALARAPELVAAYTARAGEAVPAVAVAGAAAARVPVLPEEHLPEGASRSAVLWASSASPAGSALHLATTEVARVAEGIDWQERVVAEHAQVMARSLADQRARQLLAPLVPAGLAAVIP